MREDQGGSGKKRHATVLAFPRLPTPGEPMAERIDMAGYRLGNLLSSPGADICKAGADIVTRIDLRARSARVMPPQHKVPSPVKLPIRKS